MLTSISLYLCNNSSKVGHIIYYQKATDEENIMGHIVEHDNAYITCSEGNKLNTSISNNS